MGVQATDGFLTDADLYALADEAVRSALMPGDRLDDLRDDLRHEAILGALRAQRAKPGKGRAYYAAAARSAVTDAIRRELAARGHVRDAETGAMRPARRVRADAYALADQADTGEPDPPASLEAGELGARAMAALATLPYDWRQVVELRILRGFAWERVADATGLSVETAQQMYRGGACGAPSRG